MMPTCFLVDNGSLRALSTKNLRKIAAALEQQTGQAILPASLLHSSKVDPTELEGEPAETLEPLLRRKLAEGGRDFLILPLFLGPSRALSDYLPKRIAAIKARSPDVRIRVAPCLFDTLDGTDSRLARILKDRVEEAMVPGEKRPVVLLDHGSPVPEVTYVRNFIAGQLSIMLEGRAGRVIGASMERRPGEEYRFSGPLLEEVFQQKGFDQGQVVVAMMFLSPGRHAGKKGDVSEICRQAEEGNPHLNVTMTGLMGDHPELISILADRLQQGLEQEEGTWS